MVRERGPAVRLQARQDAVALGFEKGVTVQT